jgi:hypothetical protein
MPKLIAKIHYEFEASPILHYDSKLFQVITLKPAQLKKLIKNSEESDFSLCVTFLNPENGTPSINFDLLRKNLKKGSDFSWTISEAEGRIKVLVHGEISSGPLRPGVAPILSSTYAGAKLYLDSFNFKGGVWNGFRAPVMGQTDDNYKHWHPIAEWIIN